jgi:hypothetical protein
MADWLFLQRECTAIRKLQRLHRGVLGNVIEERQRGHRGRFERHACRAVLRDRDNRIGRQDLGDLSTRRQSGDGKEQLTAAAHCDRRVLRVARGHQHERAELGGQVRVAEHDFDNLQQMAGAWLNRALDAEERIRELERAAYPFDPCDRGGNRLVLRATIPDRLYGRAAETGRHRHSQP